LFEIVELVTFNVPPLLEMPPPLPPLTFPADMVRPEMVAVTPPTLKTLTVLLPLTVSKLAPGP